MEFTLESYSNSERPWVSKLYGLDSQTTWFGFYRVFVRPIRVDNAEKNRYIYELSDGIYEYYNGGIIGQFRIDSGRITYLSRYNTEIDYVV